MRVFDNHTHLCLFSKCWWLSTTRRKDLLETNTAHLIELMTPADVGRMLGLSTASLAQLRYRGNGPRYLKPTARKVLYIRADVLAWLEASARRCTDERGDLALASGRAA
jgi:hypothetical protein